MHINTATHGAKGINWWSSDKKLKKHICDTNVNNALDKINALKHVQFDWKNDDGHVDLGYVADDVEKILPCLVFDVEQYDSETQKPNGEYKKHIDHTKIIPLITLGMQELSCEQQNLKDKYEELFKRVETLEKVLNVK